jgi:hypothetical protein
VLLGWMPFLLSRSPSRFGLNRSVWARRSVHQFPCLGTSAALCLTTSTVLLLLLAFGILEKQPGYGRAGGRRRPPPCGHRYSGVRSGQRPVAQDRAVPSKNCRSTAAGDFLPAPATDARKGVVELWLLRTPDKFLRKRGLQRQPASPPSSVSR